MIRRDLAPPPPSAFGDLTLRTPPNWTAVGFLGALGGLHLMVSVPTFVAGRWESYLSLALGTAFVAFAAAGSLFRYEVAVLASQRRVRLRYGYGRLSAERFVPFTAVRHVRLTMSGTGTRHAESKLELVCPYEDVPCPPTPIPRQQALFLALALNVPLTRVMDEEEASASARRDRTSNVRASGG